MTREIPAVDRRHVAWRQWLQRPRVVPVVEVSAVTGQASQGAKRRGRPLEQVARADVAEIVGRQVCKQQESDVRRRRAMRDLGARIFLEIVGWKPVVLLADECLEERPGLARDLAQEAGLSRGQASLAAPQGAT